jgi:ABC-type lipoprotein export system ATPase subunit
MVLYEARHLSRSFRQGETEIQAVAEASLRVEEGEFVALTGPSGGGKTTLLAILGLLDDGYQGQLRFLGQSVDGLGAAARARLRLAQIGFVFQHFNLLPELSALDNASLPAWHLGGDRRRARGRAAGLLSALGLGARLGSGPARLSGGEMQRVALARALVNDPRVVLADEPTANLDRESAGLVLSHLRRVSDEGRTVIVASHDPAVVALATRVVDLRWGRVVADRPRGLEPVRLALARCG